MKVLAMQLPALARHVQRHPFPLAITLLLCCVGLAVSSWLFSFSVPITFAMMAVPLRPDSS